nr:methylenetetrahydrofolate reductase 1 [Tanacetum cinerariifolium]
IDVIVNANNEEILGCNVHDVFVSHYQSFLGANMVCDDLSVDGLFLKNVSADTCNVMVRAISNEEIKAAMFDIGEIKPRDRIGIHRPSSRRDGILLEMTLLCY